MRMENMAGTTAFLGHVVLGLVLMNTVVSASEGKQSVAEGRWDMTLAIERLLHHYDLRIRPNFRGAPVKVGVLVDVISIDSISDVNMEYTVSYDIRQSWVDERLDFRHLYDGEKMTFEGETTLRIWRPDTFIKNGRGSRFHDVTIGQQLMHIFKNGSVIYKLRFKGIQCSFEGLETQVFKSIF
ncbi:gamma-aminobutyric acid receptor subunit beta-like [Branchiostoma floridae x Branchiostoma belcheri]